MDILCIYLDIQIFCIQAVMRLVYHVYIYMCIYIKHTYLEKLVYHSFRQLWLVLGVKLLEISSNWFFRYMYIYIYTPACTKGCFLSF